MPEYDFRSLSSFDFELLVRDLLQEEIGMLIENFKPGRDGGVDLRYSLSPDHKTVVQAKHYVESGYGPLIRELREKEVAKVTKLSPHDYILATTIPLSPTQKDELTSLFRSACTGTVTVFGKEGLNNLLGLHPVVEQRHYKLWLTSRAVLDRAVHSEILNATAYELDAIEHRMRLYVQGRGFEAAHALLESEHICIISGAPGVGKTTLAEMLVVFYLSQGYTIRRITGDVREGISIDDPDPNAHVIFYYDDFLGQTSLTEKMGKNEDSALLRFMEVVRLRPNRRLILTTREYLLQQAHKTYERLDHAELGIYKFVLDLAQYTRADRARILFNHLYFSNLTASYKEQILAGDIHLQIIDHPNYNPRIIEWMTRRGLPHSVSPEMFVTEFLNALDHPTKVWEAAFNDQISEDSRALLYVLYSLGAGVGLQELKRAFEAFVHQEPSTTHNGEHKTVARDRMMHSLKEIEGSFTLSSKESNVHTPEHIIYFHNPSIKDFVGGRLATNLPLARSILEASVYFEQCESMWRLAFDQFKQPLLDLSLESAFINALHRTLGVSARNYQTIRYAADGEIRRIRYPHTDETMCISILEMTYALSHEVVRPLLFDCLKHFQHRLDQGQTNGVEAFTLLNKIGARLLHPLTLGVANALLYADNIETFEATVKFNQSYPGLMSEDQKEEFRERFRYYCDDAFEDLEGMEPEDYRREAEKLERVAKDIDLDISPVLDLLLRGADELERIRDEEEDWTEDESRILLQHSLPEMSNAEIRAMFDALTKSLDV